MSEHPRKEFTVIKASANSCGLGDYLIMMESSRGRDDIVYVLPQKAANLAPLFYNVAPVLVMRDLDARVDNPPQNGQPFVVLSESEKAEGRALIEGIAHPIIVKRNTAPAGAVVRETDPKRWDLLVSRLRLAGWSPIQTGLASQPTIEGARRMADLPLRTLASLYSAVGVYVGVDTGDRHLMQAVGGHVYVAGPKDSDQYPYSLWHKESPLFHFCPFDEFDKLFDMLPKI